MVANVGSGGRFELTGLKVGMINRFLGLLD